MEFISVNSQIIIIILWFYLFSTYVIIIRFRRNINGIVKSCNVIPQKKYFSLSLFLATLCNSNYFVVFCILMSACKMKNDLLLYILEVNLADIKVFRK